MYNTKFLEKINEKIQNNKDLYQYLMSNKHNQILYHLKQLKILYEAVKIDEITGKNLVRITPRGISHDRKLYF
jgi:hypothetical protein